MKTYSNLNREERIAKIIQMRRADLALILEDLTESQNISAILRTAESFGVGLVCIIHTDSSKPKLSLNVSSGASKWLNIEYFENTRDCFEFLHDKEFKVLATVVNPEVSNLWDLDLKKEKIAIMVGNEAKGLSKEAIKLSDIKSY